MRPHDVHGQTRAELQQIVRTDRWAVVLGEHIVEARLVFEQVTHAGLVEQRPLHVRQQPGARLELLFDQGQHGLLVEAIFTEVRVLPQPHRQLARSHCPPHIEPCFTEPLQMFSA